MAKQTKTVKQTKTAKKPEIAQPTPEDFEQARTHLRHRADVLILELAKQYHAAKSEELTAILNAIDCATELERMEQRSVPPDAVKDSQEE
jgi:hypothetical protein